MNKVIIVGGGTAGWLSAAIIAARHTQSTNLHKGSMPTTSVTLIESPDVKNLGVGEGTWPTMRDTLRKIGITEAQFLRCCDASFKQASKFVDWHTQQQSYYHPFSAPAGYGVSNLAEHWLNTNNQDSFETYVSAQGNVCEHALAPKSTNMRDYAFHLNYGYHLNAGKFVAMLQHHCVKSLGVEYIQDHVDTVKNDASGYIESVVLRKTGPITGDLFIDCSGFAAVLIGKHYNIEYSCKRHVLFNDTALAVQIDHANALTPIASSTIATAQTNGWIWDIGLQSRRGIGHVFSSQFDDRSLAEDRLQQYIEADALLAKASVSAKTIKFSPGHRKTFWHKNCVAVGVSAGFVEPLEATALVLIEKSAEWISEQLPQTRDAMAVLSKRFNTLTEERWREIIDFLKLHYILSDRTDSDYWRAHKDPASVPESLQESMVLWKSQSPWLYESLQKFELFSSASKQYILYGMKTRDIAKGLSGTNDIQFDTASNHAVNRLRNEVHLSKERLLKTLPTNRDFFISLQKHA